MKSPSTARIPARTRQKGVPPATVTEETVIVPKTPSPKVVKTVLAASYGWPTAEMQPSRRKSSARR